MSTFKRTKVVMLPTKDRSHIRMYHGKKIIYYESTLNIKNTGESIFQHLYFLSDDEIKEGDWYYNGEEVCKYNADTCFFYPSNFESNKKIIATTDVTLGAEKGELYPEWHRFRFPSPSQGFIQKYCEKGGIDEVMVEYIDRQVVSYGNMYLKDTNGDGSYYHCTNCEAEFSRSREELIKEGVNIHMLRVSLDNSITIKPIKDSWSREELFTLKMDVLHVCAWYQGRDVDTCERVEKFFNSL